MDGILKTSKTLLHTKGGKVKTRKCQPSDVRAVYDLMCQLKPEMKFDFGEFKIRYNEIIADSNRLCIVAEQGSVIGFLELSIHIQHSLIGKRKASTIEALVVDEKARSKGSGGKLVDEAIAYAKSKDCKIIQLHSNINRDDAHRFYENHDFKKGGYYFNIKF